MQNEVQRSERRVQSQENSDLCVLRSALTCPVCEKHFHESDDGVAMPFCSGRCKMIDAARWLDERYGLPCEKPFSDEFCDGE